MPEDKADSKSVRFEIIHGRNRAIVPVSGAFGAVNASGEIVASLYFEYPSMPTEATVEVNSRGHVLSSKLFPPAKPFTREVVAMISMNPATARALAEWCTIQAEKAEGKLQQAVGLAQSARPNSETETAAAQLPPPK